MGVKPNRFSSLATWSSASALLLAASVAFLAPASVTVEYLLEDDEHLPSYVPRLHRSLSARLVPWVHERIESGVGETVGLHDVAPTEWPVFTAVFYLRATEVLAERGVDVRYAGPAVEAARDLLLDPAHHSWVRRHWGDDYLHDRNIFFRALLVSGLTSYVALHEGTFGGDASEERATLIDQLDSLSADLDGSPHGVLEDYPGETYPIDVLSAVGYVQHADEVLGTDHSAFIQRARRAFVSPYDDELGLPRFRVFLPADGAFPQDLQPGRGIGTSWIAMVAPHLWPDDAARWFDQHDRHFWQDQGWAQGYREVQRGGPLDWGEWSMEIDAGPILDGFGTAASAFGIGAAIVNGRLDHARTLSAQMLAVSAPDAWGGLRAPAILSSAVSRGHAPLLGEAALLSFVVLEPAEHVEITRGGSATPLVWTLLLGELLLFTLLALLVLRRSRRRHGAAALALAGLSLFFVSDASLIALSLALVAWLTGKPRQRATITSH